MLAESRFSIYRSAPGGVILQWDFKLNLETGPATALIKNRDSASRNLPFRLSGFGKVFPKSRPNVFQAGVNKFSGSGKMIFRSMKSTFRVRGKCFSGCCEMNFRSVENSFQGAGNYFQTRGQTTPARVPCGCPGPQLGGKVVYIKNYIIFSRKNQYIAKMLFRLCFCGVLCTPLAVSDPGVRANYLCPALLSVFSVH